MRRSMTLPKIGVNMTEAVITKWFIKSGDIIKEGDVIMEAETDKSTQEVFATISGVVAELLASEGDTVKCNEKIILFVDDEKKVIEPYRKNVDQAPNVVRSHPDKLRISPLAKKIAFENNIDILLLKPAEPGHRIVKEDVLTYIKNTAAIKTKGVMQKIPISPMRRTIASRLSESNLEKPSAALTVTVNADEIIALRSLYLQREIKMSIDAMIAKITGYALATHRVMNSFLNEDTIEIMNDINIGIAIDTDRGLVVPVLHNVDSTPLSVLNKNLARLKQDAIGARLSLSEMSGGTFTITNLGAFGVEQFTPIINPPECAILAIGAIKSEFVPDENNLPKLKKRFKLTLVFDHRIVDGVTAAKFLGDIKGFIENPLLLV